MIILTGKAKITVDGKDIADHTDAEMKIDFSPITHAQCPHLDFRGLSDEEIENSCKIFEGNAEYHGRVSLSLCFECAEKFEKELENPEFAVLEEK